MYKTQVVVTILSDSPLPEELSLESIAHEVRDGDWSGAVEQGESKGISRVEMLKELEAQESDGEFLLDNAWIYRLSTGDEVTWTDPDDDKCSRVLRIQTIEFHGDVPGADEDDIIVKITDKDGGYLEAKVAELS
jgi:hypothetical protein